ncbi:MAG: DUF2029 domain-containing protein [Chloroflexi bacterium]|nr:DUF2029 domain-containing protein [Chloroflexota bacterium]
MTRTRAIRDGLIVSGLIFNGVLVFAWGPSLLIWGDARSWRMIDLGNLYGIANESLLSVGAFRFAPAIAWLMYPLVLIPWDVFFVVFLMADLVAVGILGRRSSLLLVLAFPPVLLELINGNIHLFMALAIWAGFRWPGAWAFILLTKVTPGIGLLWFAARREWRSLGIALGTTALIAVGGWILAPGQWEAWLRSLAISAGRSVPTFMPPLALRLPVAAAVVWLAGRTGRAWLVPVASMLAMPTVWLQSTALLTACFPLWAERRRWQSSSASSDPEAADAKAAT